MDYLEDLRFEWGEDRYKLIGGIDGRLFCVIYTLRDKSIRIISARKANLQEAREYDHRSQDDSNALH